MKYLVGLFFLVLVSSAYADDELSAPEGVEILPSSPSAGQTALQKQVRPLIVLPAESLQGHTLVVPLPGDQAPPVILKRNSIETVPLTQPVLPKSGKSAPKKKPLEPIVY